MLDDTATVAQPQAKPAPKSPRSAFNREHVLEVRHFTEKLFSFKTTRNPSFRFESGQFVMIGLEIGGRPLLRAYSVTSASYDEHLEFFSIKVPNGPLTSHLASIEPGDEVLVGLKPTGTLLLGNLAPGKRLYLLATGTGFAPFASILRDPETYERFDKIIAVEGCREVAELTYATDTVMSVRSHELLGEIAADKLLYYATVTREPFHNQGRITDLIANGKLAADLGLPPLSRTEDRVMICGNPGMLADLKSMLEGQGFAEGSSGTPGDFVIERAFVER
ncbi:MAG: ferredoxin--NADP reductase [Proteobacteria bacterium]|nr:ferredoxin--NADP reductase [Pseudomonadota bacterium]